MINNQRRYTAQVNDLNTLKRILSLSLALTLSCINLGYTQNVDAGPFASGQNPLSLGGGSSTIGSNHYLILQGRFGHFIQNGLVLEMGMQSWIPLSDEASSIYVLSPGLTGYLYQLGSFIPYAGVFYQYAISDLVLEAQSAFGARGGFLLRQGGSHLGIGARVTQGVECGQDCRVVTPEISLLLNF